jgi:hypothetical protein
MLCRGEVKTRRGLSLVPRAFLARFEKSSGSLFSYVPSLELLDVTSPAAMSHSGQTIIYL